MNARRILLLIVAISVCTLAACNWTIGDCYPVGEGTTGAGAGPGSEPRPIFTSSATGDYGADPQGGGERKIACNEWELEDEEERSSEDAETPTYTYNPKTPQDQCPGAGDVAADGATFLSCSGACSSKCPKPGMAHFVWVNFDPSDFPFVTIVKDDGRGSAGGWQQAKANLKFTHRSSGGIVEWYCAITIQMPLRTELMGKIDPLYAANLSEEITEEVGQLMDYNLPPGIFCKRFAGAADAAFKSKYQGLGASVTSP
ncbi:hypothetical protein SOCEGT47_061360 [Sorangium cellulosum]|uniref:Secreted protein n=1 Tax=Sorangium cellulosum TaxID=56 RepID=A0A4P2Q8S3_SORCE|nr:hypothetical protein [Sorangium cellulosum]AUX25588.1 hypothetical protein SOCEGT47_061360 [Sorangium cellulosum]